MQYFLKDDQHGKINPGKKYGSQGDEIQVISMRGDVWIVELRNERFSVHRYNISVGEIEVIEERKSVEVKPAAVATRPRKKNTANKVSKLNNENTLF